MDPINIILIVALVISMGANASGAKTGLKKKVIGNIEKPKSFLQKYPPNISAVILAVIIIGIFKIGVFSEYYSEFEILRIIGLCMFITGSFFQVKAYKALKSNYSPEVVIQKEHQLVTESVYKYIRHPQYLNQIVSDLGAAVAVLSYIAIPLIVLVEIPLFIMRAKLEEKILEKHFKKDFEEYKKKSGFFFPFIG